MKEGKQKTTIVNKLMVGVQMRLNKGLLAELNWMSSLFTAPLEAMCAD